jgi:hypothetical protein
MKRGSENSPASALVADLADPLCFDIPSSFVICASPCISQTNCGQQVYITRIRHYDAIEEY